MSNKFPKGLIPAALANMGERFGFYTMMAILVLFLEAKFNLGKTWNSTIYSVFYAAIYLLALVGGIIADRTRNYKGTILAGLVVMTVGYTLMALPTSVRSENQTLFLILTLIGLLTIALGNGLFKGNLQALVGQMFDSNPEYAPNRDRGYQIFYLFINIGAFFAPFAASFVRNWWLAKHGFLYKAELPSLCHAYLDGKLSGDELSKFEQLAREVSTVQFTSLQDFAYHYLNTFVTGFHYAFIVSMVAMLVSLLVYVGYKKMFPDVRKQAKDSSVTREIPVMTKEEIRQRIYALLAVYVVVLFFWFSFHQNGLTLTFFAKEYTRLELFGYHITAEMFQSVNPLLIVILTPIVIAFFGWLHKRNMEPSTPRKIAIGMFIAALAYSLMAIGSLSLTPPYELKGAVLPESEKVTPWLLIGTYFILTIAELFISPLGLSFVSKVAPPQYQGLMQGGWLGATAVGNQLLLIGGILYQKLPLAATWSVFVVVCLISMTMMLLMLRWLEKFAK